jgi:mannosylglycerate hydrolase
MLGSYSAAILRGVNSTRQYLKQDNEHAERAVMEAEILASLAKLRGKAYPTEPFQLAWKEILRNHAHDSICGCSVDEVHRDMRARSAAAIQIGERLRRESLAHLAESPMVWSYRDRPREAYSVVNIQPWTRQGVIELTVPAPLRGKPLQALAADGTELPLQIIKNVEAPRAAVPVTVPGFGATEVTLTSKKSTGLGASAQPAVKVTERTLENEFYHITAQSNGSLSVLYKPTGMRINDVHFLLDEADRGDEYTYCPAEQDHAWSSLDHNARVRIGMSGPVEGSLRMALKIMLPQGLQKSRRKRSWDKLKLCPTFVEVRLLAGVDRIEFRNSVENRCHDHRLRVVFPGPAGDKVRVGGAFEVVKRDFRPPQGSREWPELPAPTRPMQHAVGVDWLSVFTKGLTEYETWSEGDSSRLAITLLRCVEWLSRGDMSTRRGEAGPSLYTPEAQCQDTYSFEYAISLRPGLSDADFLRAADDYRYGFTAGPAVANLDGLLKIEGENFCLSTLKAAEDGQGVILRLFNPGDELANVALSGAFERAEIVRLDEEPLEGEISKEKAIGPGQIVTWLLS